MTSLFLRQLGTTKLLHSLIHCLPNLGKLLRNHLAAYLKKLSGLGNGVRWPPVGLWKE